MNPGAYATLVFDCDGVVLDSNRIKTEAFRQAAYPWGEAAAEALVAHHAAHGGVSRYAKFSHFLDRILPEHAPGRLPGQDGPGLDALLDTYAQAVRAGLMSCPVALGLDELRDATEGTRWLIVSGGDQAELREIFTARGLAGHFDGGIFGSPATKHDIVERELTAGNIQYPALFLGDSRLDHEVAIRFDLDFMFVSGWTELTGWQAYCRKHGVASIGRLCEITPGVTNKRMGPSIT